MAIYCITGDLGSGKSLVSVGRIRDYLYQNRPIATNLDLYLDKLVPAASTIRPYRLPDYPTSKDLWALGKGNETPDESNNGLLVLDELGASLNTREWQNHSDRKDIIKYLLHTRKLGWDVLLIVQHVDMLVKWYRKTGQVVKL